MSCKHAQQLPPAEESSTRIYDIKNLTKEKMCLYRELAEGEHEELVLDPKGEALKQLSTQKE